MRAATMKERPSFPLMRQTDVQTIYYTGQAEAAGLYDPAER